MHAQRVSKLTSQKRRKLDHGAGMSEGRIHNEEKDRDSR